jgi:hypothetical protein
MKYDLGIVKKLMYTCPRRQNENSVVQNEYHAIWANDLVAPVFQKRNIFAPKEFMFFLTAC